MFVNSGSANDKERCYLGKYLSQGVRFGIGDDYTGYTSFSYSDATWYWFWGAFEGGSNATMKVGVNDTQYGSDSIDWQSQGGDAVTKPLGFGCRIREGTSSYDCDLNGQIDEIRVAPVYRSNNWLNEEYDNQNAPSSWYTVQTVEYN
jgi:hypothetical protein